MDIKQLVGLRKKARLKKPGFVRQDAHKVRLKKKWLRPRGLQSKVRLGFRGKPKAISSGYRSPKAIRYFHSSGLKEVNVSALKDIEKINKDLEGAVISSRVGNKKKAELVKKLTESSIKILNIKDAKKLLKDIEEGLSKRKQKRKKLTEKKQKKKAEKTKKEDKLSDKLSEEDKKKEEKKEKDKVLTKKT